MKRLVAGLLAGWMLISGLGLAEEDPEIGEFEDSEEVLAGEADVPSEESEESEESEKAQSETGKNSWYSDLYKDTDEQEDPVIGAEPADGETLDDAAVAAADADATETEIQESEAYRLIEDPENGRWEYHSAKLNIVIEKVTEKVKVGKKNMTREYCVADIQASAEAPLYPIMTDPTKKRPGGYRLTSPKTLVKKYSPLFAMSDDLYGIRLQKYDYKGVVIRNGEIISTKTRNSKNKRSWPNLDTMMLLEDGSMKALVCDAYTAEEYLNMGAKQVFSLGPILISDGEINEQVLSPKYYPYNEPRVALGMVEPYHYIAVVVKGRPKNKYAGVHLDWLAQLMKERGCVEALNLDGGLTATMMFNGKMIETGGSGLRSQGSMICFGHMPE